ncbi:MAG: class I SAM-dependent methyltransferase [Solirubrobacterales bacterium]
MSGPESVHRAEAPLRATATGRESLRGASGPLTALDAVAWHDAECGAYVADLPLWRRLADVTGSRPARVFDLGAGSGRVSLDLAAHGHAPVAVDRDPRLLAAVRRRAEVRGLDVETQRADARAVVTGRPASLVVAPMQLAQLMGGTAGRLRMLRAVAGLLRPGGRAAFALVEAGEMPDGASDGSASPDILERDGRHYESRAVAIWRQPEGWMIERRRSLRVADRTAQTQTDLTLLDAVTASELQDEARSAGLVPAGIEAVPASPEHVGSTVCVLERPA